MARITKFASVNLNESYGKRDQQGGSTSSGPSNGGNTSRSRGGMLVLIKPGAGATNGGIGRLPSPSPSPSPSPTVHYGKRELPGYGSDSSGHTASSPPLQGWLKCPNGEIPANQTGLRSEKPAFGRSSVDHVPEDARTSPAFVKPDVYAPPALRAMQVSATPATISSAVPPSPLEKPSALIRGEEFPTLQAALARPPTPPLHQRQKDIQHKQREKQQELNNQQARLHVLSVQQQMHAGKDDFQGVTDGALSLRPHSKPDQPLKDSSFGSSNQSASSWRSNQGRTRMDNANTSGISLRPQGRASFIQDIPNLDTQGPGTRNEMESSVRRDLVKGIDQSYVVGDNSTNFVKESALGGDFFVNKGRQPIGIANEIGGMGSKVLLAKEGILNGELLGMREEYPQHSTSKGIPKSSFSGKVTPLQGSPEQKEIEKDLNNRDARQSYHGSVKEDFVQGLHRDAKDSYSRISGIMQDQIVMKSRPSGFGNSRIDGTLLQHNLSENELGHARVNSDDDYNLGSAHDTRFTTRYGRSPEPTRSDIVSSRDLNTELPASYMLREGSSAGKYTGSGLGQTPKGPWEGVERSQRPSNEDRHQRFDKQAREMKPNNEEEKSNYLSQRSFNRNMSPGYSRRGVELDIARKQDDEKRSWEEGKRLILSEEERRKEAAKQKLLELEERMAKRTVEVKRKEEVDFDLKPNEKKSVCYNSVNASPEDVKEVVLVEESKNSTLEGDSVIGWKEDDLQLKHGRPSSPIVSVLPFSSPRDELSDESNFSVTGLRTVLSEEQKVISWRKEVGSHGPTSKLFSSPYIESSGPRRPADGGGTYKLF